MAKENKILWYPFEFSREADHLVVSRLMEGSSLDFSETLILTTSLRRSRRLERLFAKKIREEKKAEAVSPPLFTTLDSLVKKLFQEQAPLAGILSEEEKSYLLAQILNEEREGGDNWKVVYSYQSFIKELKSYFLEGRESLGRKIDLFFAREKESSRLDFLSAEQARRRIFRALEVFDRYQSFLKNNHLYDLEDAFRKVAENLTEKNFPFRKVWIDNFYDFTPLAWLLIKKVAEASQQVVVVSGWESKPLDHPLYLLTHRTFLSFEKLLKTRRQPLFERLPAKKVKAFFQPAKNRHDEVKQIARKICYLARQEKLRLNEIMVTFPDPLPYLSHLRTIFSRYQIPYNLSHGFPLKSSPVIKLVLALLNSVNEGYPRRLLISLFRSPLFDLVPAEVGLFMDFYSRHNGVVKGEENWLDCFKETFFSNEERKKAQEARKALKDFFASLEVFKRKSSFASFNQNLFSVLEKFGFFKKIQGEGGKNREEIKAWQALASRLTRLESFSSNFFSEEITLSGYLSILKMIVEKGEYWVEGEETAGVQVVGLLEARGMGYRYLFFGGLADELYPGKVTKELFFSERLKQALGLPDYAQRFSLFRYNFKRLIISADFAFLSFPQTEGREVFLKSRFFSDLEVKEEEWFVPENVLLAPFEFQRYWPELKEKSVLDELIGEKTRQILQRRMERAKEFEEEKEAIVLQDYNPPAELSVTEIDKYNRCGFLFLFEVILKLKPLEEPGEEMQPAFWGKFIHDFLARAFQNDLTGMNQFELEEYLKKEALSVFPLSLSSGYGLLKKWLLCSVIKKLSSFEARRFSQGFKPVAFEKPVEFELGGLRLKGRVDRVDDFRGEGCFLIDFKTKTNLTGEKVSKIKGMFSKDLQLFLYAQAFQERVLGVGYYVLHEACVDLDDYPSRKLISFLDEKKRRKFFEDYLEEKKEKSLEIVEKIKNGVFEKNGSSCFSCRYREVCPG